MAVQQGSRGLRPPAQRIRFRGSLSEGVNVSIAVVTGGAGFLGSHLCEYLLERDWRCSAWTISTPGRSRTSRTCAASTFEFRYHNCVDHISVDGPVDAVFHLASPASPVDYLRLPLATLKVGLIRHPQRAGPGQVQARPVPFDLHLRGLRRPRDPPSAGGVLGQRQPGGAARRVRRGQALRRGADDGLSPAAGRGYAHRQDLQHLRPPHARTTVARFPPSCARRWRASR